MSTDAPDLGWPDGTDLITLDEVSSTMDEAARYQGARPAWITALRQTGGRGRGGKAWHAPEGNLQATWTGPTALPLAQRPLVSFIAAMALYDTMAVWIAREHLAFKWPNDVLAGGAKIAGILLESAGTRLSVGIGVNITAAPPRDVLPEHALPAVCMHDLRMPDAPLPLRADWVLHQLASDFDRWMQHLAEDGFETIRRIWLRRAANLGQPIRVALPNETVMGSFRDVDETGHLVLDTTDGPRRIAAGDVYFEE